MMDFIFVPLVVGVVTLGIYKFFELLVCRRERRMIIDKMDGNALIDFLKFVPMGVRIGARVGASRVGRGVRNPEGRLPFAGHRFRAALRLHVAELVCL